MKNIYLPSNNYIIINKNNKKNKIYLSSKKISKYDILNIDSKVYKGKIEYVSSINTYKKKKFIIESK